MTDDAGEQRRGTAGTWSSLSSVGGHRASVIERTASTPRQPRPSRTSLRRSRAPSPTSSVASRVSAFEAIGLHAPNRRRRAEHGRHAVHRCGNLQRRRGGSVLPLKPGSVVIRHASDGDWCEVTDCTTGKRGKVPASAAGGARDDRGRPANDTAPEREEGRAAAPVADGEAQAEGLPSSRRSERALTQVIFHVARRRAPRRQSRRRRGRARRSG